MRRPLVLDAEAFSGLAGPKSRRQAEVQAALKASIQLRRDVVVPAVVLAELYRGPKHNKLVDACLSREEGIRIRDTDRGLARYVGGVLAGAGVGSEHLADAHVVAVAVEAGEGLVLTGDADDLNRLAEPYPNVIVKHLP